MNSKKLNIGPKDIINSLPEALIYHILSFLSTKEAAITSLLSRKWRYFFAFVPNLDFDDPVRMQPDMGNQEETEIHTSFMDFVDRVLALRGNSHVNKFSLKCGNGVDGVGVTRWILNTLELSVSELDLSIASDTTYLFPSKVFVSKSLVRLRIEARNGLAFGSLVIDVGDVSLPKLKTLYLDSVELDYQIICLAKLLSGCHVLEELVMIDVVWNFWESCSASIPTLKRLTFFTEEGWNNPPPSVTFDNPALVYFEYTDTVALKYEKVNFDSLVEARLGLRVGYEESENPIQVPFGFPFPLIEYAMVGDATDLLMGIRNVQVLYLYASTVEVLTFRCKAIPIFNNLTRLTIESNTKVGWDSLPNLLKNCPNLKTLVFQGLLHKATDRCGDMCPCKPPENIHTCLSSSPVKVLEILKFGEINDKTELEQTKHFLELMPHLEQLNIYYDTSVDDNLVKVSKQLQEIPGVASAKCKVQVISDNLTLSVTLPSSSSI
ncbi:putative protein [Arabidopsis thaliana]|uniref:Putative F-box/LRR-repeat protein At3g59230 n=1 Tax=Arabidopsis thaliana TaxID=3702 RepID=FBL66_ARATH|nr:RNI-like superfamily protein [Arabidopsis thaliana]Q9LX48.1 RecName: Full=Putative F-box/LRR-repeat protein At3g59230 [Arabidopsis thaliana]AEE79894.1 RNI-like superfamily protein [Arabidopsis thaliana]CAB91593.1 putative protein [Arabidopsis thaliana]|eukprot:NP_191482.1 RNI-like superfamily protein [Arabidopsis thaliana]